MELINSRGLTERSQEKRAWFLSLSMPILGMTLQNITLRRLLCKSKWSYFEYSCILVHFLKHTPVSHRNLSLMSLWSEHTQSLIDLGKLMKVFHHHENWWAQVFKRINSIFTKPLKRTVLKPAAWKVFVSAHAHSSTPKAHLIICVSRWINFLQFRGSRCAFCTIQYLMHTHRTDTRETKIEIILTGHNQFHNTPMH